MYILDTNICIFAINKKPKKVLEIIKEKSKVGLHISSLTVAGICQDSFRQELLNYAVFEIGRYTVWTGLLL